MLPWKFLFIAALSVSLTREHALDFACCWLLATYRRGWRSLSADLRSLLLFLLVLFTFDRYIDWHRWFHLQMPSPLLNAGEALKKTVIQQITKFATGSLDGFLRAVFIGDKSGLNGLQKDAFRALGISHMLAVSGFHVGLLVGATALVGKLFPGRWGKWLLYVLQSSFLVVYASAVGAGPSVVRAVGTFILARAAMMWPVKVHPLHWPLVMGCIAWFWQPLVVLNLGCQLSYAAVFGILLALGRSEGANFMNAFALGKGQSLPILEKIFIPLQVSLAAWSATLPLVQTNFGGSSSWFLLGNLVVVPVYSFFMGGSLLLLILPCPEIMWTFWNEAFNMWTQSVLLLAGLLCESPFLP